MPDNTRRRRQIDAAVDEAVRGKKAEAPKPKRALSNEDRSNLAKAARVVGRLMDGPSGLGLGARVGDMVAERLRKAQTTDSNN